MFKRRQPTPLWLRTRNTLWPRTGWRRAGRYVMHRLGRLPGTPYSIAAGFACGAALSFTPFVGFHILISAVLSWLIRANLIASAVGTLVGNPWTFPLIWVWLYESGRRMGIGVGGKDAAEVNFTETFTGMLEATLMMDFHHLIEVAGPVFMPMLVSSVPTAATVGLVCYALLKPLVSRYRERRLRARQRRVRQLVDIADAKRLAHEET